jgi:hypothetical protein
MAVYSSAMVESGGAPVFRIVERDGPAGRLVMQQESGDAAQRLVIAAFRGPELPPRLTNPVIEPVSGSADAWRLGCAEGEFHFQARAVDRLTEHPALFAPMHRAFALSGTDRIAVRVLLWLLRLPGGARWLRLWHARRG